MTRLVKIVRNIPNMFLLFIGSLVALIGITVLCGGLYGLIAGMHGGIISAAIIGIFGASLAFIGIFVGCEGAAEIRDKNKANSKLH
jgi:hypothetical protein